MSPNLEVIKAFWKGSLRRIPSSALHGVELSEGTKRFLTEVGLPQDASSALNQALVVNFYFDQKAIIKKTFNGVDYCVIGDDSGTNFCISLHDDSVCAVDFNNVVPIPFCFVNSSIRQFIQCIQTFSKFQQLANGGKTDLVKAMMAEFDAIDAKCLSEGSTWWSIVVNQPF